jgi:hypothetical protein
MDAEMMGMCGTYCGACAWKEKMNCPGGQASQGRMFWGECKVARCAVEKGCAHCGLCPDLVCGKLRDAFSTPGHEDHGERLDNLKGWAEGKSKYINLGTYQSGGKENG